MLKVSYRKTKRGRIHKLNREVYLRKDIPCGFAACPFCEASVSPLTFESEFEKFVFIIDLNTFMNQMDLIQNCPVLRNVVVFQTIFEELNVRKPAAFSVLKNLIEVETFRKFYIFPNEFFESTYTTLEMDETMEARNERAVLKAALYYKDHLQGTAEVLFITNSFKAHSAAQNRGLNSLTIHEFVKQHCQEYPSLIDYLGFHEEEMDLEYDSSKPSIFEPHLELEGLTQGVKSGDFFQGKISTDRNNSEEARVFLHKYGIEARIKGLKNLNRSMNGDIVALKLLPENEWQTKREVVIEDEDEPIDDPSSQIIKGTAQNDSLKHLIEKIKSFNLIPTAKVIGILKRQQRNFCGHIIVKNNGFCEFVPADSRYPHFEISLRNPKDFETKKIIVGFNKWDTKSEFPQAHFIGVIGEIGNLETESKVILMEHNVETREFSKQVLACLPLEESKWRIPEEEIKRRLDLRGINVCSIDPIGCKDIDDALHCRRLPNGNFEVGVHIADVSYFVRSDSAIDLEAAHRCTTVYLVERRTDMLPKLLTETLCSLKGGEERLAFSVIWEMNKNADIVKVDYKKTIIQSKAALNYGQAQGMMDDQNDTSDLTISIRDLNFLAKKLKAKRIENGALQLASTQVKFTFDDETHNATDVAFYHLYETNSLVEEFMLLANVAVAEKIVTHFPSNAVLRKHTSPKAIQIRDFGKLLNSLNFKLDYSSSRALADSLDQITRPKDPFFNQLVRILTTRCMNEAVYFCTADEDLPEFHHYGLACPLYTHFTSPIRRYADVLVHRLLAASIDLESLPNTLSNKQKVKKICEKMNMRNRMARFASRASSDYHTYLFFKGKKMIEDAMITNIRNDGFSVIMPRYGLEGFIPLEEREREKEEKQEFITKVRIKGKELRIFDHIKNMLRNKFWKKNDEKKTKYGFLFN